MSILFWSPALLSQQVSTPHEAVFWEQRQPCKAGIQTAGMVRFHSVSP